MENCRKRKRPWNRNFSNLKKDISYICVILYFHVLYIAMLNHLKKHSKLGLQYKNYLIKT